MCTCTCTRLHYVAMGQHGGTVVSAVGPGFESRPFCVELACSPRVCVGFLRVLRFPPTSKDMHSILLSLPRDQGTGIRTGVGPRALHCGCPLFLTSLGWVKCRGQISPPGLIKYDLFLYFYTGQTAQWHFSSCGYSRQPYRKGLMFRWENNNQKTAVKIAENTGFFFFLWLVSLPAFWGELCSASSSLPYNEGMSCLLPRGYPPWVVWGSARSHTLGSIASSCLPAASWMVQVLYKLAWEGGGGREMEQVVLNNLPSTSTILTILLRPLQAIAVVASGLNESDGPDSQIHTRDLQKTKSTILT